MLLIPAIDLKDGHCVRLKQGEMDDATVFSEEPAAMARHWIDLGARRLHLVDAHHIISMRTGHLLVYLGDDHARVFDCRFRRIARGPERAQTVRIRR